MLKPISSFRRLLLAWFHRDRRDLPWRVPPGSDLDLKPDPYHVFVSEAMLQQTQVATVIPYFHRFIEAFPTVQDLASADEERVLRLWQGLGYYSRARNLQRAAKAIVDRHGGRIPDTVDALLALPGVGRYTAGAIASIAHGVCAPIVDGNVVRVLTRLDAIERDPRDRAVLAVLWDRAAELVPEDRPGAFNSAMMELGATVCTPRNPNCLICPVATACGARASGIQDRIPPPKKAKATPLERRTIWCVRRVGQANQIEFLFEQRPPTGRWAKMWQFVTRPRVDGEPPPDAARLGTVAHALTHRRYEFDIVLIDESDITPIVALAPAEGRARRWLSLAASEEIPLPKPHVEVRNRLLAIAASA